MKIRLLLPLIAALLATSAPAQETPTPRPHVSRLAAFAGHFEGSGTFVMSPGAEPVEWTAVQVTEAVLGGFAYQSNVTMDVGAMMPGGYKLETLSAFDAESNELVRVLADNMGSGDVVLLHWVGEDTLVATTQVVMHGNLIRERTVTRLTESGYDVRLDWTINDSEPFEHRVGSYKRVEPGTSVADAAVAEPKVWGAIKAMERFVGTWESTGWMLPAPGMDKVRFTGTQVVAPILGGGVLREEVIGQADGSPRAHEGISYIYHDPVAKCFRHFGATNNGDVGRSKGWVLEGGSLCFMTTGSAMGTPIADRTLVEFDDQGPVRMSSDRIQADGAGARVFELNYKRD